MRPTGSSDASHSPCRRVGRRLGTRPDRSRRVCRGLGRRRLSGGRRTRLWRPAISPRPPQVSSLEEAFPYPLPSPDETALAAILFGARATALLLVAMGTVGLVAARVDLVGTMPGRSLAGGVALLLRPHVAVPEARVAPPYRRPRDHVVAVVTPGLVRLVVGPSVRDGLVFPSAVVRALPPGRRLVSGRGPALLLAARRVEGEAVNDKSRVRSQSSTFHSRTQSWSYARVPSSCHNGTPYYLSHSAHYDWSYRSGPYPCRYYRNGRLNFKSPSS